jgi:hypothetical protein
LLSRKHGFGRVGGIRPLVQYPQENLVSQAWSLEGIAGRLAQQEEAKIALL